VHTVDLATTRVCEFEIKERIIILLQSDEHFNMVKEILHQEPKRKTHEGYQLRANELLLYNNRLCIPNSIELGNLITYEFHNRSYMCHPGYHKMITTVRQMYYFP